MEATALLLSRLRLDFTVSFHIIYPSFHDRIGGVAHSARRPLSCDRAAGISVGV
jgi:hypothetical protein